jgi:hypothetical protein
MMFHVPSRVMDEELQKRLFHDADTRPSLSSSNHAPQREIIYSILLSYTA